MSQSCLRQLSGVLLLLGAPLLGLAQTTADPAVVQVGGGPPFGSPFIPLGFVLGLVLIWVVHATLREKRKLELIALFVEKGQQIPSQLLARPSSRHGARRVGMFLTAFGLSLGLLIYVLADEPRYVAWCLIPLFLGAASFVNAAFFYPDPHR